MKTTTLFRHVTGKAIVRKKANVLLSLIGLLIICSNISAQNTASLIVTPTPTITQVGQSFSVNVRADFTGTPSSADAAEVHLTFDNTKLNVTAITRPSSASLPNEVIPLQPLGTINTNGQINYSAYTLGAPLTADFDILNITFTVLAGTGTSTPLTLLRVAPLTNSDVYSGGLSIINVVTSGSVAITSGSCTLAGATISNTATCNGQAFNLVLQSITGGGTSPYSLVVNGTTYNNVNVGSSFASYTPATSTIYNTDPTPSHYEDNPLELGIRFTSSQAGFIKGVRFFSDDDVDAGATYTGTLRTADGTLLASAVYAGPIPNDTWMSVLFSSPVEIAANTEYMVTYHTTGISHGEEIGGAAGAVNNPPSPLTTVAGGAVFRYTNTFLAGGSSVLNFDPSNNNYEADVLFTPSSYTFNLTSVTDAGACAITGAPLQQLTVNSPNCNTLPITLARLSATPEKKDITISWTTASEINNEGFEIQRSSDNRSWEGIAFVKGAGNSNSLLNYSYIDKGLFPQRYYYRLKQVDIDKKYKFSTIVTATIDGKPESSLGQNYPNPFRGETLIPYTIGKTTRVNLSIFDLNGRAMKVLVNGMQDAGSHNLYFYTGSLPAGVYYYRLTADGFSSVKKLVIR
jgi:hypothetical protein